VVVVDQEMYGGNDMQVSGAEAAYSNEKGISTNAESRTGTESNRGGSQDHIQIQHQKRLFIRPDTSTVGIAAPDTNYSTSEIEKGYTDEGVQLSNVNGTYMTKAEMYSTGMIERRSYNWKRCSRKIYCKS
jgi:hypothetical protein